MKLVRTKPFPRSQLESMGCACTLVEDVERALSNVAPIGKARYYELSERERLILASIQSHMEQLAAKLLESSQLLAVAGGDDGE